MYGKPIRVEVDKAYTIEIMSSPIFSIDPIRHSIESPECIYLKIHSLSDASLSSYMRIKSILQDFFNFIISSPVDVLSFEGYVEKEPGSKQDLVKILYRSTRTRKMNKPAVHATYILDHGDIENQFGDVLQKWFHLETEMRIVYEL